MSRNSALFLAGVVIVLALGFLMPWVLKNPF